MNADLSAEAWAKADEEDLTQRQQRVGRTQRRGAGEPQMDTDGHR